MECTVDRVYPVDGLEFQLMSDDTVVTSRQSGISSVNRDDTFSVTKVFSVTFSRSYSSTEAGLTCKVYHSRGNSQSVHLAVVVACESGTSYT